MTEKRFRVQEHCLRSSYGIEAENWLVTNDNRGVVLNNKSEAHMVANMLNDVIDVLNELNDENKELKNKNSQLQETLAFRSNQLALMERLVDDLGSEEMARQMEEILND